MCPDTESPGTISSVSNLTTPQQPPSEQPIPGLPVHGYTPQPSWRVQAVNNNKVIEEHLLRLLDEAKRYPLGIDQRWANIARTHFEQGFMALNRAYFRPQRLSNEELEAAEQQRLAFTDLFKIEMPT